MQLQVIQEATTVVEEDVSMTTSNLTRTNSKIANNEIVLAEELHSAEGKGSQELTEHEIDEFRSREQISASEGNNADINSKYTSQLGMEFKGKNEA